MMTTLACDGKVIAADSLVTGNGLAHDFAFQKVRRLNSGSVAGFTGTIYGVEEAMRFLNDEIDKLSLGDDFEALILHIDGTCEAMDGNGRRYRQSVPAVAGSGGGIALGALHAGKDPLEAVTIAAKFDVHSGGAINFMAPAKPIQEA